MTASENYPCKNFTSETSWSMAYDCGDPSCPIRSDAGQNFEGVIAYAMETLRTVFDLTASVGNVKFRG